MKDLFNFRLFHPDNISPWESFPKGTDMPGVPSLGWYGLTLGYYQLDLGNKRLYEYSHEIIDDWKLNKELPFVDYQIGCLFYDLTDMLDAINEQLPENYYLLAKNVDTLFPFQSKALSLLKKNSNNDETDAYQKFCKITSWISDRALTSEHLVGGPQIFFFRSSNKISIVWRADYVTEKNVGIWASNQGQIEMLYSDFKNEVLKFGNCFLSAMDEQVRISIEKDWENIEVNKTELLENQKKIRKDFNETIAELDKDRATHKTNWEDISTLINEISEK